MSVVKEQIKTLIKIAFHRGSMQKDGRDDLQSLCEEYTSTSSV